MRFANRTVWITGASSGIGEALAKAFHAEGASVILSSRREKELNQVANTLTGVSGAGVTVLPFDVTDETAVMEAARKIIEQSGPIDILVNNAGLTQRARVAETELSVFREVMEVNYFGPLMMTKAVLPSMIDHGRGHIVTITSVAAKYGSPLRSGYNAAKHAAHGFFDALREEVTEHGIDVTLIVPGAVRTNISLNALTGNGARYGRMDRFLERGLPPEICATRILDAVHTRKREIMIARGAARRHVYLKAVAPRLLSRVLRRR